MVATAEHHDEQATSTQSHHLSNGDAHRSGKTLAGHPGHPPQPADSKWAGAINTGSPAVPYFTPLANPSPGTAFGNKSVPKLFESWKLRDVEFRNRVIAAPMCQYSAETGTGLPNDYHLVHQGTLAARGVGLIITEATAVTPDGRISPEDLGIWSDEHIPAYQRIVQFLHSQGAKAGIQLAHGGRKSSTYAPWLSDGLISKPTNPQLLESVHVPKELGGYDVRAPSELPFAKNYPRPRQMTLEDIEEIKAAFVAAAARAEKSGYDVVEIHAAHGYLLHEFLSPLSNKRTDRYGGSLENRLRLILEVIKAVRAIWPASKPLFLRVSASDWHEDGEGDAKEWKSWGIQQTAILAEQIKDLGVDLIDVSSGGNYSGQKIALGPGYQVPFARELKRNPALKNLLVGTVGLITDPHQAEEILQNDEADVVLLARELLRHADWVTDAAYALETVVSVPNQYQRAHTRMFKMLETQE